MGKLDLPKKLIELGDIEGAIEELKAVLKENPQDTEGWYLLAEIIPDKNVKRWCYEQVLRLQPNNMQIIQKIKNLNPLQEVQSGTINEISISLDAQTTQISPTYLSSEPNTDIDKDKNKNQPPKNLCIKNESHEPKKSTFTEEAFALFQEYKIFVFIIAVSASLINGGELQF